MMQNEEEDERQGERVELCKGGDSSIGTALHLLAKTQDYMIVALHLLAKAQDYVSHTC